MATGYKKYMKKEVKKDYPLLKLFAASFFGMLLVFTFIIKSFSPTVDTSIGDYKQETEIELKEEKNKVDNRLAMIQDEDQGKNFTELMKKATDVVPSTANTNVQNEVVLSVSEPSEQKVQEPIYKVFIGTYTSSEQAKVAKDIIQEAGLNMNPIVKCLGSNNYTLQVGIFKSKESANTLLYTIQQNHLPGRVVEEY